MVGYHHFLVPETTICFIRLFQLDDEANLYIKKGCITINIHCPPGNSSPLKIGTWKMNFLFGRRIFRRRFSLELQGQPVLYGCFKRTIPNHYIKNGWKSPFPSIKKWWALGYRKKRCKKLLGFFLGFLGRITSDFGSCISSCDVPRI